jgi:hypothetical protein
VFEHENTDPSKFDITAMKDIKRAASGKRGRVQGHRRFDDRSLLSYRDARHLIYLAAYRWVLENRLGAEVQQLRDILATRDIVLLDYEINQNVDDLSNPLSHAALLKRFILGEWPTQI